MEVVNIVSHPFKINPLIAEDLGEIASRVTFGPIGLNRYSIRTDSPAAFHAVQAYPYCFVFDSHIISRYSADDCLTMLSALLKMFLGAFPSSFETQRFAYPATTHIYPVYKGDYLYVCEEERAYIDAMHSDLNSLLGLRVVTHDPLCWLNMKIPNAIEWFGSCVLHSEDFPDQRDNINDTLKYMEEARRRGFVARVTNSIDFELQQVVSEMRNGKIVFDYVPGRDMRSEREAASARKIVQ